MDVLEIREDIHGPAVLIQVEIELVLAVVVVLADEEGGIGMLVFLHRQIDVGVWDEHLHADDDVVILGGLGGGVDVQYVAAVFAPVVGVDHLNAFFAAVLGIHRYGGAVVQRSAVPAGILLAEFICHSLVRYLGEY